MAPARILIVDDEIDILDYCARLVGSLPGALVFTEQHSREAARRLETERFDLIITDLSMPGLTGVQLLEKAREHDLEVAALIITGYPTLNSAIECLKLGALDYIIKPFLPTQLFAAINRLLDYRRLRRENRFLLQRVERASSFGELIGKSPRMLQFVERLETVARTDVDVLIAGETGSGKELVARSIHHQSSRSSGRFVPVDCTSIPESLMESEFFGHEAGAYTGASRDSLGLFQFADKGTLFLDEIGDLPLPMQAKLLRCLQERKIRRVGGREELPVDVRLVVATNRDLAGMIGAHTFREELFYRINVVRLDVPPLKDRGEDILLLARHFIDRYARQTGHGAVELHPEAAEMLMKYPWPGNVRELENTIKGALARAGGDQLVHDHFPEALIVQSALSSPQEDGGYFQLREQRLAAFEIEYLQALLRSHQGDVSGAAREARLPRGTLYRLLKKHFLVPEKFRE